jgi:hypothetical protein
MENFCYELIKFLESEYPNDYIFKLEKNVILPQYLKPSNAKFTLTINITPKYKLIVNDESLQYIYKVYISEEFIKERNLYAWQKELMDIIEGS